MGPDFQPLHGRYTPDDVASIKKALADTVVIRDRVNQLYASAPNGSSVYLSDIHALEAIPLFETSCNFVDYAYRTRQLMGEPRSSSRAGCSTDLLNWWSSRVG